MFDSGIPSLQALCLDSVTTKCLIEARIEFFEHLCIGDEKATIAKFAEQSETFKKAHAHIQKCIIEHMKEFLKNVTKNTRQGKYFSLPGQSTTFALLCKLNKVPLLMLHLDDFTSYKNGTFHPKKAKEHLSIAIQYGHLKLVKALWQKLTSDKSYREAALNHQFYPRAMERIAVRSDQVEILRWLRGLEFAYTPPIRPLIRDACQYESIECFKYCYELYSAEGKQVLHDLLSGSTANKNIKMVGLIFEKFKNIKLSYKDEHIEHTLLCCLGNPQLKNPRVLNFLWEKLSKRRQDNILNKINGEPGWTEYFTNPFYDGFAQSLYFYNGSWLLDHCEPDKKERLLNIMIRENPEDRAPGMEKETAWVFEALNNEAVAWDEKKLKLIINDFLSMLNGMIEVNPKDLEKEKNSCLQEVEAIDSKNLIASKKTIIQLIPTVFNLFCKSITSFNDKNSDSVFRLWLQLPVKTKNKTSVDNAFQLIRAAVEFTTYEVFRKVLLSPGTTGIFKKFDLERKCNLFLRCSRLGDMNKVSALLQVETEPSNLEKMVLTVCNDKTVIKDSFKNNQIQLLALLWQKLISIERSNSSKINFVTALMDSVTSHETYHNYKDSCSNIVKHHWLWSLLSDEQRKDFTKPEFWINKIKKLSSFEEIQAGLDFILVGFDSTQLHDLFSYDGATLLKHINASKHKDKLVNYLQMNVAPAILEDVKASSSYCTIL